MNQRNLRDELKHPAKGLEKDTDKQSNNNMKMFLLSLIIRKM